MKRLAILFVTVLLLSSSSCTGVQTADCSYIIGFYNLENLFDIYDDPVKNDQQFLPDGSYKWTGEKYGHKLKNMSHVIAQMAETNGCWHTILGISEVENRQVIEDLVSQPEIAAADYRIVHYDSPDRRGVDVALLYNPKQFKLLESESIPYTFFPEDQLEYTRTAAEKKHFRTRDILMVRGTIDGEMFAFYVTHLPSRAGGGDEDLRNGGALIIYRHAMELMADYPGIKIVVMGDMNDDPTDSSMSVYLRGRETIEGMESTDFFNPYISMLKDGFGSLCHQGNWSIFDQELVNCNLANAPDGTLKIQPTGNDGYYGYIYKRPFLTTEKGRYKGYPYRTFSGNNFIGGFSDHYPTYIVIGK